MIDAAIEQIYTYIEENDDCQFTMQELRNAISSEYISDEKTVRKRPIDHYHDDIVISCFCASYKQATLYEASATFATPPEIKPGSFAQFVHDNADSNINTIDDKGTFHYMGSIEIIAPADSIQPQRPIKRLKTFLP
ncbi:hypothetical protein TNCV_2528181 [Trichonephila clavipes]|nr:hypothetical protein TNCV_2528181 [Trichonephila clavipes]